MASEPGLMREGITRGILVCFFILAPTIFLFYQPRSKELQEDRRRLATLESELQNARQVATTRDDLRTVTDKLQRTLAFYEERLPSESDIPGLLEELQEIVTMANVRLDDIEMIKRRTISNYESIPFNLAVSGGYHAIGLAVNNIEKGRRFMGVNNIKIGSDGSSPHQALVEVSTFRFIAAKG